MKKGLVIAGVLAAFLGLSGCAQMDRLAGSAWSGTERAATKAYTSVAKLLRPAPQQTYRFATHEVDVTPRYTIPVSSPYPIEQAPQYAELNPYSAGRSQMSWGTSPGQIRPANAVAVYRGETSGQVDARNDTGASAPFVDSAAPAARPALRSYNYPHVSTPQIFRPIPRNLTGAAEEMSTGAPDSFSYVRLSGASNPSDWSGCEAASEGAFIVTQTSTTINPDFDTCMRERGYVTEIEAISIWDE